MDAQQMDDERLLSIKEGELKGTRKKVEALLDKKRDCLPDLPGRAQEELREEQSQSAEDEGVGGMMDQMLKNHPGATEEQLLADIEAYGF